MRRTIVMLLLPGALALAGCDRDDGQGPASDEEAVADRGAEEAARPEPGSEGPHARHHRGRRGGKRGAKLDHLCERLACTETQRTEIEALVKSIPRPPKGDHAEANAALARAFESEGFGVSDLQAHRDAIHPSQDAWRAQMSTTAVALHALLDAEQRVRLADHVAEHGLPLVEGKRGGRGARGHRGKHGPGPHGDAGAEAGQAPHGGPQARAERRVQRLCATLACTDPQRAEIVAQWSKAPDRDARDDRHAEQQAARAALAEAVRGETLAPEAVGAYLDGVWQAKAAHMAGDDARLVALHGLLTPEQRATLATKIAERGPWALTKDGKRGDRKHRRGHRRRRPADEVGEAPNAFG